MKEVKITIDYDGNKTELTGRAVLGMVFDPVGVKADMVQFLNGHGNTCRMLIKMAEGLWSLAEKTCKDETDKIVTGALMIEGIKKAMLGESNLESCEDWKGEE